MTRRRRVTQDAAAPPQVRPQRGLHLKADTGRETLSLMSFIVSQEEITSEEDRDDKEAGLAKTRKTSKRAAK